MAKLTLTDILSGFNLASAYNANNALIEAALENTLSRDGTSPNSMEANLDLNSNRIINLAPGVDDNDAVTKAQLAAALGTSESEIGNVYNVRDYGAVADRTTNNDAAFRAAAALCVNPSDIILVPDGNGDHPTNPGYLLSTADYLDYLGTLTNHPTSPGCVTIVLCPMLVSATLVVPGGHRIVGRALSDNNIYGGSMIRASSAMSSSDDAVQLGRRVGHTGYAGTEDEAIDGTTLEWMTVAGPDNYVPTHRQRGVVSYSAQERSGLRNCIVRNFYDGVVFLPGNGINPSNWVVEYTDVFGAKVSRYGMYLYNAAGKSRVIKPTLVVRDSAGTAVTASNSGGNFRFTTSAAHGLTVGDTVYINGDVAANGTHSVTAVTSTTFDTNIAYAVTSSAMVFRRAGDQALTLLGGNIRAEDVHVESWLNGAVYGGYGSGNTYNHEVDGLGGYNEAYFPLMTALARFKDTDAHAWKLNLRRWNTNNTTSVTNVILDELQNITIPCTSVYQYGTKYLIGGTYNVDSAVASTTRPIETDLFNDHTTVTLSANQDNYDLGNTGVLVISSSTAASYSFSGFAGGFRGRRLVIQNASNYPQRLLNNTTSSTNNRIRTANGLSAGATNVTIYPNEAVELVWGEGPTLPTTANLNWHARKISRGPQVAHIYTTSATTTTTTTLTTAGTDYVLGTHDQGAAFGSGLTVSTNRITVNNGASSNAGLYEATYSCYADFTSGAGYPLDVRVALKINGTTIATMHNFYETFGAASVGRRIVISGVLYLNGADYIEPVAMASVNGTTVIIGDGSLTLKKLSEE